MPETNISVDELNAFSLQGNLEQIMADLNNLGVNPEYAKLIGLDNTTPIRAVGDNKTGFLPHLVALDPEITEDHEDMIIIRRDANKGRVQVTRTCPKRPILRKKVIVGTN